MMIAWSLCHFIQSSSWTKKPKHCRRLNAGANWWRAHGKIQLYSFHLFYFPYHNTDSTEMLLLCVTAKAKTQNTQSNTKNSVCPELTPPSSTLKLCQVNRWVQVPVTSKCTPRATHPAPECHCSVHSHEHASNPHLWLLQQRWTGQKSYLITIYVFENYRHIFVSAFD